MQTRQFGAQIWWFVARQIGLKKRQKVNCMIHSFM